MTFAPQSSPLSGRLPAFLWLSLLASHESRVTSYESATHASRQERVTLRVETSFFTGANGTRLGTLQPGATVTVRRTTSDWQQVTFEGWIITASTGPSTHPEFSLAVNTPDGENLRAEPEGAVVARAIRGTGFTRLARRGVWTQVRRSAWIQVPASGESRVAQTRDSRVASRDSAPPSTSITPSSERVVVRKGAGLALGPGGAVIGTAPDGLQADVVERSGNWVRIRTDTWVLAEEVVPMPPDSARVTLEELRANPARFVGQPVTWRLQFLSVQKADELRPELPPGLPYLLTRGPLPEAGFVYVAITAEQAARFRAMNPLDEFVARGTIRAARTKYLPTPVIDLLR